MHALKEIEALVREGARPSFRAIAAYNNVDRKRLAKLYWEMVEKGLSPKDYDLFQPVNGRPEYLDDFHVEAFITVVKTFDAMADPLTEQGLADLLFAIAKRQMGPTARRPCFNTIKKYVKKSGVPLRSVRNGENIRTEKSKPEYLIGFFRELKSLILRLQLGPSQIWNSDEVGIKVVDAKLRMATSRANIRMQFNDLDHITAMITSNASGLIAPTLLIYPPSALSVAMLAAFPEGKLIAATQEKAYMDRAIFRSWLHHFIAKAKGM